MTDGSPEDLQDGVPAGPQAFTAGPDDAGERLDRFLAARLPGLTRSRIKALIEEGCLAAGGATIRQPSLRVKPGQTFAILVPEAQPVELVGQRIPLRVVHEDPDLIVIDKAAGLVVHPAPGNPDRTLVNALIAHCGDSLKGVGGVRRPGIVHRLDKDTSGLIVAAKTEAAHQGLVAQFAARSIERSYLALVWGRPRPEAGTITGDIGRSPRNRKKMAVVRRGGRPATTHYRSLRHLAGDRVSLVECRLETGRTHQIRVHLASRGHPLLGDPLYGRGDRERLKALAAGREAAPPPLTRQALHARSLGFIHPTSGEALKFESEIPNDMKDLLNYLEAV
ncbi:MAG: RluA family pseudouridine synthase [Kiloniellales bacterium]|nr:RluA family pseudouridine synthase [Kiloniellales bacterium]